jgi:hypothetical protein
MYPADVGELIDRAVNASIQSRRRADRRADRAHG